MNRMVSLIGQWLLNSTTRNTSYTGFQRNFEANQQAVLDNVRKASPQDEKNQRLMTHIIGIERWGQTRLRQFLGVAPGEHEYDSYRPAQDTAWDDLTSLFEQTRQETSTLIAQLSAANLQGRRVAHNAYGNLSPKAWLRYLALHALLESKKLK